MKSSSSSESSSSSSGLYIPLNFKDCKWAIPELLILKKKKREWGYGEYSIYIHYIIENYSLLGDLKQKQYFEINLDGARGVVFHVQDLTVLGLRKKLIEKLKRNKPDR